MQPFVSASWKSVANAMLFWPFSPIRGVNHQCQRRDDATAR